MPRTRACPAARRSRSRGSCSSTAPTRTPAGSATGGRRRSRRSRARSATARTRRTSRRTPDELELARLLLDAGADPNDAQTLYNNMWRKTNEHLELLFAYGLGSGDGGPWRARLADQPSPAEMLEEQLRFAAETGQRRARRAAAPRTASTSNGLGMHHPTLRGRSALELARRERARARRRAADGRGRDGAAARSRRRAARRVHARRPRARARADRGRRRARGGGARARSAPAGRRGRRQDGPRPCGCWSSSASTSTRDTARPTALHLAAYDGSRELVDVLLELGADPNVRDRDFDATPAGWARHAHHDELADHLAALEADRDVTTARGAAVSGRAANPPDAMIHLLAISDYWWGWGNLLFRWLHVIAAIAWIGSSFYFIALDNHLKPPAEERDARARRRRRGLGDPRRRLLPDREVHGRAARAARAPLLVQVGGVHDVALGLRALRRRVLHPPADVPDRPDRDRPRVVGGRRDRGRRARRRVGRLRRALPLPRRHRVGARALRVRVRLPQRVGGRASCSRRARRTSRSARCSGRSWPRTSSS